MKLVSIAGVAPRRNLTAVAAVAAVAFAQLLSGCGTMLAGRPTTALTAKRTEPGVVLCMSERTSGGGIRIIGKVDPGVFPITGATIQYRTAGVSDPVPATPVGSRLELTGARSEKVNYRKGANEVVYAIDASAARTLRDKVLWYRWIIRYDRNGSEFTDVTDIHRTSVEEAGVPRSGSTPGPDSSVAPATTRRR